MCTIPVCRYIIKMIKDIELEVVLYYTDLRTRSCFVGAVARCFRSWET